MTSTRMETRLSPSSWRNCGTGRNYRGLVDDNAELDGVFVTIELETVELERDEDPAAPEEAPLLVKAELNIPEREEVLVFEEDPAELEEAALLGEAVVRVELDETVEALRLEVLEEETFEELEDVERDVPALEDAWLDDDVVEAATLDGEELELEPAALDEDEEVDEAFADEDDEVGFEMFTEPK